MGLAFQRVNTPTRRTPAVLLLTLHSDVCFKCALTYYTNLMPEMSGKYQMQIHQRPLEADWGREELSTDIHVLTKTTLH